MTVKSYLKYVFVTIPAEVDDEGEHGFQWTGKVYAYGDLKPKFVSEQFDERKDAEEAAEKWIADLRASRENGAEGKYSVEFWACSAPKSAGDVYRLTAAVLGWFESNGFCCYVSMEKLTVSAPAEILKSAPETISGHDAAVLENGYGRVRCFAKFECKLDGASPGEAKQLADFLEDARRQGVAAGFRIVLGWPKPAVSEYAFSEETDGPAVQGAWSPTAALSFDNLSRAVSKNCFDVFGGFDFY